ncbi:MAG: VCBS repeat-containing protein [Bacteroidota bacterium]
MKIQRYLGVLIASMMTLCACHSDMHPWTMHIIDNTSSGADGTKLIDANSDGNLDIATGWEQGHVARLYLHPGPGHVDDSWKYVEVPAPHVEDALPVDLDQDGSVDLLTCSEGDHMRLTIHWGPKDTQSLLDTSHWESVDIPVSIGKTRWMFAEEMEVDGKHGPDLIVGSKDPDATLGWLEIPEDPRQVEEWQYHEISPANWVMTIKILDINQDGLSDILISDRNGPHRGVKWFQNPGPQSSNLRSHWASVAIGMTEADPLFLDVVSSSDNGMLEMWVPNLRGYFMHFWQANLSGTEWGSERWEIPEMAGLIGKSAAIGDIDLDGKYDLITTYDGAEEKSGVLWSTYDENKESWVHHDVSGLMGIKYDFASLIDMDGDGDLDILTSEEANNSQQGPGLGVIWYENPFSHN